MRSVILALLLDLANIAGGFLLAIGLIRRLPRVGAELGRFADRAAPQGWIVGIVALALGTAYLLMHLLAGPRVFHFEIVGIGVGLALLWDRITGRRAPEPAPASDGPTGRALLLAVFGVVAIIVGLQGLFTPD
ncbi:hypothetical protein ACQP2P_13735 [Dactylosporangium sp. CA-139114]|uniref:hypothetical protein n=1 Tax=Dactylosporangium sp. CA-139114 TaxID=3239931 RepID=UPI003D993E38